MFLGLKDPGRSSSGPRVTCEQRKKNWWLLLSRTKEAPRRSTRACRSVHCAAEATSHLRPAVSAAGAAARSGRAWPLPTLAVPAPGVRRAPGALTPQDGPHQRAHTPVPRLQTNRRGDIWKH